MKKTTMNILLSNFLKYFLIFFIIAFFSLILFQLNPNIVFAKTDNTFNNESIYDFINDDQSIETECLIDNGNGRQFILYELNPIGYAIFLMNNNNYTFLEGSYEAHSPFYDYLDKKLVYCGVGSYYYECDGKYVDIIAETNQSSINNENSYKSYNNTHYHSEICQKNNTTCFKSTTPPDNFGSYIDSNGYTKINDAEYFSSLSIYPENREYDCGIVALSMLLGYLDNYRDGRFIDNINHPEYIDNNGTTQSLYYKLREYLHQAWKLMSNGHTTWPMDASRLNSVMEDYLQDLNNPSLNANLFSEHQALVYTHANPKNFLSNGYPVILVMTGYTYDNNSYGIEHSHCAIAYGFKSDGDATNDKFIIHAGWDPGTTDRAQLIVSSLTIESYYVLNTTHQHNYNIYGNYCNDSHDAYCDCGLYGNFQHSFYRFTKTNTVSHISYCRCGYSQSDLHSFIQIKQKLVCKDCRYAHTSPEVPFYPTAIDAINLAL